MRLAEIEAVRERQCRALQDLEPGDISSRVTWPFNVVKREPLHPNFSYKSGYHAVPAHYQTVVDNILASER